MSAVAWHPNDEELQSFLDATTESGTRVRQVLIVMAVASVIMFSAVWNSAPISWMRWRAEVTMALETWVAYQQDGKDKARWDALKNKVQAAGAKADPVEKQQLKAWQKQMDTGEKYSDRGAVSLAQIKEVAKKYRDATQESAAIRIPFFGVAVDVNDATLIGGLTLCIIMMWLRLSLWRHCSNLSMAFAQADAAHRLQFAYRYLSMQQVLSVPPPTADANRDLRPKHGAPPPLFWLPVIVQLGAIGNDLMSFDIVNKGSGPLIHAVLQTFVAFLFLATLLVLTWDCGKLRRESRKIWQHYSHRLQP